MRPGAANGALKIERFQLHLLRRRLVLRRINHCRDRARGGKLDRQQYER